MVLVARLLAGFVLGAVIGASVHDVDDALVGVRQLLLSTNRELVVLISGKNGHFAVVRKGIRTVMHDRAVIIRHSKCTSASLLIKIKPHVTLDIVELNDKSFVSILTALFVVQTDCVSNFVECRGVPDAASE